MAGGVVLNEGENGAAVGQAAVGDAGQFELGAGRDAAQVEGFERGVREVETTIKKGI